MKALILNSGVGKRMKPITNEIPKCLVKLNGNTILGYQIESLIKVGIGEIIMTTGPFDEKIKSFMSENFPHVKVKYIKNEKYETTNYIYSLWLTKGHIDDDIILLHGDTVFEQELLNRLIKCKNKNCVLINNKIELPQKDFKAQIIDGKIKRIGVDVFAENSFFLAPLYKFSKEDFLIWMNEIENFIKGGEVNKYAEDAFNEIHYKIDLHPTFFGEEFCMEIDTADDLKIAKKFFTNKERNSKE